MTGDFSIEEHPHGLVIVGGVPLDQLEELVAFARERGHTYADGLLCGKLRASQNPEISMVLTNEEHGRLWRLELSKSEERGARSEEEGPLGSVLAVPVEPK